jgi:hypothetical protein
MRWRWDDKRTIITIALLGLGLILLATFAGSLGIDRNDAWGAKRLLALILGVVLDLSSVFLWDAARRVRHPEGRSRPWSADSVPIVSALGMLLVLTAYVWFASIGQWTSLPPTGYYYDQLADTFLHGHLDVASRVTPALLRLENPYDPEARSGVEGLREIWDLSFYNGKVYAYFGAAPALILAALKLIHPGQVGDAPVTLAYASGLFVFECLLILGIARRCFTGLPAWTIAIVVVVIGIAHPVPWVLTKPRVYEAAVAAGQFFLVGGFYFAFVALARTSRLIPGLVLAGTFWAFAVGTRAILVFPVVFLTLMLLYRIWGWRSGSLGLHRLARPALAMMLPLAVGAVVIGWYNWARFGSALEPGLRYQIGMVDLHRYYAEVFSPAHIPPNLYIYFFNPPALSHRFPFIRPVLALHVLSQVAASKGGLFISERFTGILLSTPFIIFAIVPGAIVLGGLARRRPEPLCTQGTGSPQDLLRWAVLSLIGSCALTSFSLLLYFYGAVRYLLEITPFGLILATVGFWQGYNHLNQLPWRRAALGAAAIALATASTLCAVLLAFSNDVDRIRANNPALLPHLILFFTQVSRRLGF